MGEERTELSPITETQLCLDLCAAQAVLWHIWKPSIVKGFSCGIQASMKAGDSGAPGKNTAFRLHLIILFNSPREKSN